MSKYDIIISSRYIKEDIMIAISFSEVSELKAEVKDRFSAVVHFHDRCGGQFFNLEEANDELKEYIEEFFAKKNMQAIFSEDGLHFTLESSIH